MRTTLRIRVLRRVATVELESKINHEIRTLEAMDPKITVTDIQYFKWDIRCYDVMIQYMTII